MGNRIMAASLALALGSIALPLAAAVIPTANVADPLAPLDAVADAVEPSSEAMAQLLSWVIASGDNGGVPFMVIDKVAAKVFVFDAQGQLLGTSPALLGVTPGDESSPGVGDRELSAIKPKDRTTPAGRFVAKFGTASGHRNVLWVDYVTSISLHPVITVNKKERRLQRLKSPTPDDNRITFGCINVPALFYTKIVRPVFEETAGVVYILPETKPLNEVFLAFQAQSPESPHGGIAH
jgi:hypothetical protein